MIPALDRFRPARPRLALAGAVVLAMGLALAPGARAGSSLRAAAAACALGGAALLARSSQARGAPGPRLVIVARQALSREVGVALLELDGRQFLVGFGAGGVQVLDPATPPHPAPASPEGALP